MKKQYRIKNEEGLYSSGGVAPSWVKIESAKTWKSVRALRLHLTTVQKGNHYMKPLSTYPYKNCNVQTFKIDETILNVEPPLDLMKKIT